MRFAGDDATRLAAIDRACASGADVAIITRGGYGLTRLLPRIRTRRRQGHRQAACSSSA
jgi:muramoyltetrapeptide carboxypeptidase